MIPIVFIVFPVFVSVLAAPASQFRVIKEWNYINYTWLNYETQIRAVERRDYIPQNNLVAGISFYDGFYYLAVPRMKLGVPVTLARINSANPRPAPLLEPYPSWEMNQIGNCTSLQNVQNIAADAQGRLWIIDGGKTRTLTRTPDTTCSPKLMIYDIKESKIFLSYTFPAEVAKPSVSFLYDLVIDNSDGGYAYITDNSRLDPGLIVYSLGQNKSWKVRDENTMRADPLAVEFKINGEIIRTPINVAGIALGPKTNINEQNITLNENRQVFFCPISSFHLYSVSTAYLKDENYSKSKSDDFSGHVRDIGVKASQTDGMKMDNKGILYYGLLSKASIVRWDSTTPFSSGQQIIAKDSNYIQWPNSFAFDDGGNVIVLTNELEKYIQNKMNLDEPNFRILMAYVDGKSYVYDDETLVYSVYETDKQNITANSTIISHHIPTRHETTTTVSKEAPTTTFQDEDVTDATTILPNFATANTTTIAKDDSTSTTVKTNEETTTSKTTDMKNTSKKIENQISNTTMKTNEEITTSKTTDMKNTSKKIENQISNTTMKTNEEITTSKTTDMKNTSKTTENRISNSTMKTNEEKSVGSSNTTEQKGKAPQSSGLRVIVSLQVVIYVCLQYLFIV